MEEQPKLTCELVPSSQWENNLRSILSKQKWDDLRHACYQKANWHCEVCGGQGPKHKVECHEIWEYQDGPEWVQTLTGLISLCPDCHKVKHIGFAASQGDGPFARAIDHLMAVNGWDDNTTERYLTQQFHIHAIRSQQNWTLNLDWLKGADAYIADAERSVADKRTARVQATLAAMTRKSRS